MGDHTMMKGGHGPTKQLQDFNRGVFNHAPHAPHAIKVLQLLHIITPVTLVQARV